MRLLPIALACQLLAGSTGCDSKASETASEHDDSADRDDEHDGQDEHGEDEADDDAPDAGRTPRSDASTSRGDGGHRDASGHTMDPEQDAETPDGKLGDPIPKQCEGFPLEGLTESPGGDVLPNKCQPFHPTLNNPYAVRCIDAWPWYDTGFPGDQYCILPPPKGKGIQVGFHPQGDAYFAQMGQKDLSGYRSLAADWLVTAGGEETRTYHAPVANPSARKYYRTYFRMRTGSHHNIISMHKGVQPAGWEPARGEALPGFFDPAAGQLAGVLGGQERPDDNTPVTLDAPPEDEGLYLNFPADPNIHYNVHFFNTSDEPMLKEGWVNIWFEESGTNPSSWFMGLEFGQVLLLDIPPNTTRDLHYSFTAPSTTRLVRFFGHRHAWTTNFTGWVQRKDGKIETIYQSFDWMDMPTLRYDSLVKNAVPDFAKRTDGGTSGVLTLEAGDKLHFNCHIEYTDERAMAEGAPSPETNGNLKFANQALTAEMCIAFGSTTGGNLGLPRVDTSPLPDVAKK